MEYQWCMIGYDCRKRPRGLKNKLLGDKEQREMADTFYDALVGFGVPLNSTRVALARFRKMSRALLAR